MNNENMNATGGMQTQPVMQSQSVAQPQGKKTNVLAIILGILMIIFAGAAIFFGVKYFMPDKQNGTGGQASTQQSENVALDAKMISAGMTQEYDAVRDVVKNTMENVVGNDNLTSILVNGILYKPEGLNTYVRTKMALGYEYRADDETDKYVKQIGDELKKAGFSYMGELPTDMGSDSVYTAYLDSGNNILCAIAASTKYASADFSYKYVDFRCANTGWVWISEAESALLKGMEDAYYRSEGKYPVEISGVFVDKIVDSKYAPYQKVWVGIGNAAALFYRVSPDAEWRYFTGTQDALSCSEYNTEDLKKAYLGDTCYDDQSGSMSTVQL